MNPPFVVSLLSISEASIEPYEPKISISAYRLEKSTGPISTKRPLKVVFAQAFGEPLEALKDWKLLRLLAKKRFK